MPTQLTPADGWAVRHISNPRGLSGANGCRFGPDAFKDGETWVVEDDDMALHSGTLLVAEAGAEQLISLGLSAGRELSEVATGLPVGDGKGGVRTTLNGLPDMIPGPISRFAGVDVDDRGRVYVAGDRDGVVVVLEPAPA